MTFTLDSISKAAYDAMWDTQDNILLLGKAGTGKSTLISTYIKETNKTKNKNIAVVAPTGVAAMNIGGQTIHSFFKFSANVTVDDARQRALWHKKQKIFQVLDTLIIDEISMVRADLLDCIDIFLRTVRKNYQPFGGVQVIMVGDLLQLPPIVSHMEAAHFAENYSSAYFFAAAVMKNPAFVFHPFHLEKVYRQEDDNFVHLLHRIRSNTATESDLEVLNARVERVTTIAPGEIYITTTNMRANEVNATMLGRLKDEEYRIFARAKGKINESSYPTDDELVIKKGAQIMFLVNNVEKGFMNGTIGIIVDILQYDDDFEGKPKEFEVKVLIPGRSDPIIVGPHVWEIRESRYDEKEKAIKSETVGTFEQIPIRLAWACTIHKAQGKTFDSMIIDSGSGMFAPGQAYVALSRCTSLSGIKLVRPIMMRDIMLDNVVSNYVTQLSSMSIVVPEQTLPVVKKGILERITKKYTDATAPMSVLVFDTETTGVNRTARIVQIACALYEKDENNNRSCTTVYDYLINPLCPIPAETTAVHGINDDMVKDAPTLDMIRENVHQLFDRAHIHVAHNIAFDERILAQEVRRLKLAKITKRPIFCTMMEGVEVVRIPSDRGGYKWPKLAELYTHLWQENVDGYHDALVDVKAAAACYFKMKGETYNPFH